MRSSSDARDRRRYRKIYTRLWRNPDFLRMSSDEKVMALYVLSGPQTNRIGLFVLSLGAASEELNTPLPRLKSHLATVCSAFGWEFDCAARVIWVPSWWSFNDPKENVKAFQGALTDLNDVPPTPLIEKFCANVDDIPSGLRGLMGERTGIERVSNVHPIRARSQEQEQEQEQEKEQEQEVPDVALLFDMWNGLSSLPKAQAKTPDRIRHAKARLKEHPDLVWWATAFRRVAESDFLAGRRPSKEHPGWRADLDFVLKPGTAEKVMEGKYDNRVAATGTNGQGRTGAPPAGKYDGLEEV